MLYSQFLEYHGIHLAKAAVHASTMEEQPKVPQTPAETFSMSCHFAASRAHHAQEAQSNNPFTELDCYLSNPLEDLQIDIFEFWTVSFLLKFYFNM